MIYTIEEIKEKIRPIAEKYNLPAVYLFGSYARGEADEKSDIDIMVNLDGTAVKGLFDYAGVYLDITDRFEKEIDMIEEAALRETRDKMFVANIKKDMVNIYAG
ncbi:MAG: nucleotidyltransferase domain-containing protein [Ruminococcus sp.]|jgi:predicted nucleotidyltransferase|nr:nucleotidyltransferase domain-containing protein [Ruminococcus sp.]